MGLFKSLFGGREEPSPPDSADEYCHLGNSLMALNRPEEALDYYEDALKLDLRHVIAWANQGVCLHMLGRFEEALTCHVRAIELDSRIDIRTWYMRGFAEMEIGKGEEAKRSFQVFMKGADPREDAELIEDVQQRLKALP